MISRVIEQLVAKDIRPGYVTALFGARRTGKTILLQRIAELFPDKKILQLNGEDYDVVEVIEREMEKHDV